MGVERKIGEIFEVDGKVVECVETNNACHTNDGKKCVFLSDGILGQVICFEKSIKEKTGTCSFVIRTDKQDVCFVEVQK